MKMLTRIAALGLAFALFSGVLPSSGFCAMAQKTVTSCAMPCCKSTPIKAASCPLIRQALPQDTIAQGSLQLSQNVTVAATFALRDFVALVDGVSFFDRREAVPKFERCSTPQSIPAPPVLA